MGSGGDQIKKRGLSWHKGNFNPEDFKPDIATANLTRRHAMFRMGGALAGTAIIGGLVTDAYKDYGKRPYGEIRNTRELACKIDEVLEMLRLYEEATDRSSHKLPVWQEGMILLMRELTGAREAETRLHFAAIRDETPLKQDVFLLRRQLKRVDDGLRECKESISAQPTPPGMEKMKAKIIGNLDLMISQMGTVASSAGFWLWDDDKARMRP